MVGLVRRLMYSAGKCFLIATVLAGAACKAAATPAPGPAPRSPVPSAAPAPSATPAALTVFVWVEYGMLRVGELQTIHVKVVDAQLAPAVGAQVQIEISSADYGVQSLALPDTDAQGESRFAGTVGEFKAGTLFEVEVTATAGQISATGSTSYTVWP